MSKSEPKFKVGDKVVVTKIYFSFDQIGQVLMIEGFRYGERRASCRNPQSDFDQLWNYPQDCIELEPVYNSPLYKALR